MFDVLFQYGPVTFRTFNVFSAVGFLLGMIFLIRYIHRKKMSATFLVNYLLPLLLLGILGGRLLSVFENFSVYSEHPLQALRLWDMEFSPFGIFYGIFAGLCGFSKRANENFWAWFDGFVLAGLVALTLIHIGHFLNGSHYGTPTDLFWGITFDNINIPFVNPIHPTQLYSALITFLIFAFLMKKGRRIHLSGMVGSLGIMLYSVSAMLLDFLHGIPSLYAKITFGTFSIAAFIFYLHSSHQTYAQTNNL